MGFPLKRYQKDFEHSYALGVFAALELLEHQPAHARQVLLHSKGRDNAGVAKIESICASRNIPCAVNDRAVERLAPRESHYAIGVFAKYRPSLAPDVDHVVLVNPADMGNLGAILRTLVGFGVPNLALVRPAADIFDPKAVRASMGAVFQVAFAYFDDFAAYRRAFPGHALYAFMTGGRVPLAEAVFSRPCALVFGNESRGLAPEFAALGTSVAIPHSDKIDSLSLPTAVGIAVYELLRAQGSGISAQGSGLRAQE